MSGFGFGTPFQEQLDFFRKKLNLPSERYDDIVKAAHDKAFIVAGAMKADLLNDLRAAVDKAITEGTGLTQFRKDFAAIVQKHGWTGWTGEGSKAGVAWRTKVIYQTNMATSYAAGRWQQLMHPDLLSVRPYWKYHHADGVMYPRPLHVSWNGLVLPYDHPFWLTHFPPNGWGCHCYVSAVDETAYQQALQIGKGEPPKGWQTIDLKTGAPIGIDKGFDYAPGANANRPLTDFITQKLINLSAPIGSLMWETLQPVMLAEQTAAFSDLVTTVMDERVARGKLMAVGALRPIWIEVAEEQGVAPVTADIIVRDKDVLHTFRDTKADKLDLSWYGRLPQHVANPDAVILDTSKPDEPAFLLLFNQVDRATNKLVVRINYHIKKVGLANIVETGKVIDDEGVKAMIGHGYTLIEGSL